MSHLAVESLDGLSEESLEPPAKRPSSGELYPSQDEDSLHQVVWMRRHRSGSSWLVFGAEECHLLEDQLQQGESLVYLSHKSRQRRVNLDRMAYETRGRRRDRWVSSSLLRGLFPVSLSFHRGDSIPSGEEVSAEITDCEDLPGLWYRGGDSGQWEAFSRGLSRTLESAYLADPHRLVCLTVCHIAYSFDFQKMYMFRADKQLLTILPLRRSPPRSKLIEVPWRHPPTTETPSWSKYSMASSSVTVHESRETHEFMFAAGLFSKFSGNFKYSLSMESRI